jgi:hypothetical protein
MVAALRGAGLAFSRGIGSTAVFAQDGRHRHGHYNRHCRMVLRHDPDDRTRSCRSNVVATSRVQTTYPGLGALGLKSFPQRVRHLAAVLMLTAMAAFVAHSGMLGSTHAAAHGNGSTSWQLADHPQGAGEIAQDQTAGDLTAADQGDGPDQATHAHCPLCCAGACTVAPTVSSTAFTLVLFRIGFIGLDHEAGHGIDPDGPRRPPRATHIA